MSDNTPENGREQIERMSDFFTARLDTYEEHMLTDEGKQLYEKVAELVPKNTRKLLDLGCGTGLELDEIYRLIPDVSVVGIDLAQSMLDRLGEKHPDKDLKIICEDYFKIEFGENCYDAVISFMTVHHFQREEKIGLYTRIKKALKPDGLYIECDYIASDQSVEDELYNEYLRIRSEEGISEDEYYHVDIPYTVDNQVEMFKEAGFFTVEIAYQVGNAAIIVSGKLGESLNE